MLPPVMAALLLIGASVASSPAAQAVTLSGDTRPNIIVLMIDDLAEMDTRLWDRLPTIKQVFLDHGVRLTRYSGSDPLCCPGRTTFLTGQYASHTGVVYNDARLFDPSETIATKLQAAGYWTMISGKYLNRTENLANKLPPGWNRAAIFSGGYWGYREFVQGRRVDRGTADADYSTDVYAAQAISWLKKAPRTRPVFAVVTPYAVHSGSGKDGSAQAFLPAVPPRYVGDRRCAGIDDWSPPGFNEEEVSDKPPFIQSLPSDRYPLPGATGWPLETDCEALLAVDDELAHLRTTMQAQGRWRNTFLLLVSDNGMTYGAHRWPAKAVPYATPMPAFVHWTAGLTNKPGSIDTAIQNVDWAPTLCALAGCEMGPFADGFGLDGISVLPVIQARGGPSGRDALFEEFPLEWTNDPSGESPIGMPRWRGVRTTSESTLGLWVYTEWGDGFHELYDMAADPWQLDNHGDDPNYAVIQEQLALRLAAFGP